MAGFRLAVKAKTAKVAKAAETAHASSGVVHSDWNGKGGFKPGNQYGAKPGGPKEKPAAKPRKPKAQDEPTGLVQRVEASKPAAYHEKVKNTTQELHRLAAGDHGSSKSVHAHIDKIARGAKKDELFHAAKDAGITHSAKTKKELVDHLKRTHADKNTESSESKKPTGLAKRVEESKKETAKIALKSKKEKITKEDAVKHVDHIDKHSQSMKPHEIDSEVSKLHHLSGKDLDHVVNHVLKSNVRGSKSAKIDMIAKKIHQARDTKDRIDRIGGKPAAPDSAPPTPLAHVAPVEAKTKTPKTESTIEKPKATPEPKPEKHKPVLSDAGKDAVAKLRDLQSKAHTMSPSDIDSQIKTISSRIKGDDIAAAQHEFLGAKAGSTKSDAIKGFAKKIHDFRASKDRIATIEEPKSQSATQTKVLEKSKAIHDIKHAKNMMSTQQMESHVSKLMGKSVKSEDVASMIGSPDSGKIRVTDHNDHSITLTTEGDGFYTVRKIIKDDKGKTYIKNDFMEVTDAGKGVGGQIFSRQVDHASAMGIDRMETVAARSLNADGSNSFVGYKVWPKFGYDAKLQPDQIQRLPKSLKKAKTVGDLMATPEGRDHWDKNGGSMSMNFDLKPGSKSMKIFSDYQAKKVAQHG